MKRDLFEKISTEIVRDFPDAPVRMHMHGESTLHPEFCGLLDIFSELKKKYSSNNMIEISTNGQYSDKITDALIDSGIVYSVTFSVDASDSKVYEKIRRGGDFDILLKNFEQLLSKNIDRKTTLPYTYLQFIVMEENQHQIDDFAAKFSILYKKYGITPVIEKDYFFKEMDKHRIMFLRKIVGEDFNSLKQQKYFDDLHLQSIHNVIPKKSDNSDSKKTRTVEKLNQFRYPCPGLWLYIGIHPDGTVSPCCQDPDGSFVLGNLNDEKLIDIWTGEKIEKYRLDQIAGAFSNPCSDCTNQIEAGFSDEELKDYLIKIGKSELWQKFTLRRKI